jgi:anthranilate synthase
MDRKKEQIERFQYDFAFGDLSTEGLARTNPTVAAAPPVETGPIVSDHAPGPAANLFDAVLRQRVSSV